MLAGLCVVLGEPDGERALAFDGGGDPVGARGHPVVFEGRLDGCGAGGDSGGGGSRSHLVDSRSCRGWCGCVSVVC